MPLTVGNGASTPGMRNVPSPVAPTVSTTTTPSFGTVTPFPTTPTPLSAADVQGFAERRSFASRRFQEALARRDFGIGGAEQAFEMFSNRLDRDQGKAKRTLANTLAARGQAFQPRFMGRGLVDLRDSFADQKAQGRSELASTVAQLTEAAQLAELERDEELAAIERDRARRQSDLDQLIRPLAGA